MTGTARSVELRAIAQRIADALPATAVEAVVTGSVSRGVADELSDIEMLIVTDDEPDLDACFALAAECGLTDLDTWGRQGLPTRRVSGYREGVPIELIWWSRAYAETAIDAIFEGEASGSADALANGVALRTTGLLARWQERLRRYPEELARAHIEDAALTWGGFAAAGLLTLVRPGERPALLERMVDDASRVVRMVYALNGVWPPTLKRLAERTATLPRKPDRMAERIAEALTERDARRALLLMTELQADAVALAPDGPNVVRARQWLADGREILLGGTIRDMTWAEFTTDDDALLIAGRRAGSGPRVLLLHGGPGLGFDYLRELAEELAEENDVAWYQQRGQEPSAVGGPYSVALDVEDARRVLDALGWDTAYVVGHSWGGHLALHVAEAMPERLLGVLSVDPLGAIGDGRWAEFDEEMFRRTPESVRDRAREIDELSMAGKADDELALEGMRLVWPAYFGDPASAPPMPNLRLAPERSGEMVPSIFEALPALEAGLPEIRVPVGFVHGSRSPMPLGTSTDTAERIPGAWVEVVEGAGHFIWHEAPGAVRAALRRLTADSEADPPG